MKLDTLDAVVEEIKAEFPGYSVTLDQTRKTILVERSDGYYVCICYHNMGRGDLVRFLTYQLTRSNRHDHQG